MSVHSVHPLRETGELVLKKGMEKDGKKRGSIFFVFLCVPGNALKMRRKTGRQPFEVSWRNVRCMRTDDLETENEIVRTGVPAPGSSAAARLHRQ